jgi:hypothetical protein
MDTEHPAAHLDIHIGGSEEIRRDKYLGRYFHPIHSSAWSEYPRHGDTVRQL